jgi:hypothetical protein
MFSLKNNQKTFFILLFMVGLLSFSPITPNGDLQEADAQKIVHDPKHKAVSSNNLKVNSKSLILKTTLFDKEIVLDGIAAQLAKQIVQNMTQSIVTWINSGFQGSPAFVTDLQGFLLDSADQVAGDFIYNDPSLNFLCSPFQLDVKIALATTYQQQSHGRFTEEAQCTLSDVTDNVEGFLNGSFSEGGWDSWFEVTQNPVNTPTGAYLAAEGEMYARIVDEQGRQIEELGWGNGFLSFKVCSDTDVASGKQTDCDITTPGTVIANQINKSLGAGQDALITADEINEIIGALFAQLAQQAITGINGMLGLGGSSYSNNSFGDGNDSYLDALKKENIQTSSTTSPIDNALKNEQENIDLQNTIIRKVNDVEGRIASSTAQNSGCFNVKLPNTLKEKRQQAINQILISNGALTILTQLKTQYATATDPQEKLRLINLLQQMTDRGQLVSISDNIELELYVEFDFADALTTLNTQIANAIRSCQQGNSR